MKQIRMVVKKEKAGEIKKRLEKQDINCLIVNSMRTDNSEIVINATLRGVHYNTNEIEIGVKHIRGGIYIYAGDIIFAREVQK